MVFLAFPAYAQDPVADLQVTPEYLDFGEVEACSTTGSTEQITISNCGDSDSVLCWQVEPQDCWLSVEDVSGTIDLTEGGDKYVQVSVSASGLCLDDLLPDVVGEHTGTFIVYQYDYDYSGSPPDCTGTLSQSETIAATMTISEYNVLEVDPDELNFGTDLNELTFDVLNTGEGEMEWEALVSGDTEWLTIEGGTSASGTVESGASDTVTVRVDRSKVGGCVDEFSITVEVTSPNASPSEATVSVSMQKVIEPPQPSSPNPADGSIDQSSYATLKWQEGGSQQDVGGIVYFDVYFSTDQSSVESNSPSILVCNDLEIPYCDPSNGEGQLDAHTTYYWKVKAVDECEDNTVYSDVWSFTTGSAETPTCPASVALRLDDKEMNILRGFRDKVLAKSLAGERYINLYYSPHAFEALLILLFNPELRMCANEIVKESISAIQLLLRGETTLIDSETITELQLFLDEFEKDASPNLKKTISTIKKDIATGDLFGGFGFSFFK